MDCPFCNVDPDRVFFESERIFCVWDQHPVSPGHALIIPRRHVASWFAATENEQIELTQAITKVRDLILDRHAADGFNVGINDGAPAGQTVGHLHVHVIPRYRDDVADPTGGIRGVIPDKANYLAPPSVDSTSKQSDGRQRLVTGGGDALLPHLVRHLQGAERADIAVAFLRRSGLRLVGGHLRDMLDKGGKLRVITGDYLSITEPEALLEICDWMQHPKYEGRVEARFFRSQKVSFHPKGFLFHQSGQAEQSVAIVGSTNLSRMALTDGIEWSYQVYAQHDLTGLVEVSEAFEKLWMHPDAFNLDEAVVQGYREGRKPSSIPAPEAEPERPDAPPAPHAIQIEALQALEETREKGFRAGLVVLATGLGKTWLSAFDSNRTEYNRVLFVAHREEILSQAMDTYRRIRPTAHLGFYNGQQHDPNADIVFASVQTLSRKQHLERFEPEAFDYIVVDEFHHATAMTYRRLIDYFEPRFTLGLTATPDRTDSSDLLALCQYNEVYRCGIPRAIELNLLSPFHYYGVADDVDYEQIPWRNQRFDMDSLTQHWATQERANNALEQLRDKAGQRTLAFCCSTPHADFMREFARDRNLRAAAVHSGSTSDARTQSLELLAVGELDVIFAVDIFNEGVDVPEIDTILMLRPTASKILWLQQLGRGLRWAEGKILRVIDYIGNHRAFRVKPEALLQALMGIDPGRYDVARRLNEVTRGEAQLPPGCQVTYDLETVNILDQIVGRSNEGPTAIETYYDDYKAVHGYRPDAAHIFNQGYNPRALAPQTWLQFVMQREPEWSNPNRRWIDGPAGRFAESLEQTLMTKSYKMILLLALLDNESMPGRMSISSLVNAFVRITRRSPHWLRDVSIDINDTGAVRRLLVENPIKAWCGGRSTGGTSFFSFENDIFKTNFSTAPEDSQSFSEWVREIVTWRLAQYVDRSDRREAGNDMICRVIQSGGRPIIKLPDNMSNRSTPWGWVPVTIGDIQYQANFVKIAVNVIRKEGSKHNELPDLMRDMFGQDAGQQGTRYSVVFEPVTDESYHLKPYESQGAVPKAQVGMAYQRREIPDLLGLNTPKDRGDKLE